jgi:cytosine/adenosine deaminase-related metal-dependent hydrolase
MHPNHGWPAHIYWSDTSPSWWRAEADLSALERLCAGVTTGLSVIGATPARMDDTIFADVNAQAYLESGLGLVIAVGPPDPVFPHLAEPFVAQHVEGDRLVARTFTVADTVRNSATVIDRWHGAGGGRLSVALAPPYLFGRHVRHRRVEHRLPSAGDATTMLAHAREMRSLADDKNVLLQTHMFAGSVSYALQHFGVPEVDRLLGDRDVLVCHANGLSDEEVRVLGAHGCGIASVAYTHENLWYGTAPVPALAKAGCPVAITTDGAAPYTSLDLWRELARTTWIQWAATSTQEVMPPEMVLRMVTIEAARALRLADHIGSLAPGKDADIVVVDLDAPHFGPVVDLAQSLVYYATASDVRDVIAKGSILLRDRRPVRMDASSILERAREEAARALQRTDLSVYGRGGLERWRAGPHWPRIRIS